MERPKTDGSVLPLTDYYLADMSDAWAHSNVLGWVPYKNGDGGDFWQMQVGSRVLSWAFDNGPTDIGYVFGASQ
jgi:hypothetical protein